VRRSVPSGCAQHRFFETLLLSRIRKEWSREEWSQEVVRTGILVADWHLTDVAISRLNAQLQDRNSIR
jgi:hypothetical protein